MQRGIFCRKWKFHLSFISAFNILDIPCIYIYIYMFVCVYILYIYLGIWCIFNGISTLYESFDSEIWLFCKCLIVITTIVSIFRSVILYLFVEKLSFAHIYTIYIYIYILNQKYIICKRTFRSIDKEGLHHAPHVSRSGTWPTDALSCHT